MTSTRIDSLVDRIRMFEQQSTDNSSSHRNRYTSPAYTLKKRLDVLGAQLRIPISKSYTTPWYVTNDNCFSLIIQSYDMMMTDIYRHISYLINLDRYTHEVTSNRGYYSRKKSQTYMYLNSTYTTTPWQIYTMRDIAWEWFFTKPLPSRPPLHAFLFNYLMKLQDDESKKDFHTYDN